jgi:putative ABC transport system permease protein
MSWIQRLANTIRAGRHDRDVEREIAFHLDERADELRAQGMADSEARRHARLRFGNPVVQRERTRDVDIALGIDALLRHLRYAVRALLRAPGFTLTVVVTLALGIGANSAVFSAMDAVLLRPLPFPDSDQLMRLRQAQENESSIAPPRLEDWNRLSAAFEVISGYYVEEVSDTTGDLPQRLRRAVVAPRFLEVLGVKPALGRSFNAEEYRFGGPASVLISDRYWKTRLVSSPRAIGTVIHIEGRSYPIVGVLPADFTFPDREVDLWWPYPIDGPLAQDTPDNRRLQWYTGIGRLKPGASLEQAHADLALVQEQLAKQFPDTDARLAVRILPLKDIVGAGMRGSLWLLFGAVSLLLLIACTNIAALLLSRTAKRESEIAVRISLGASRAAVARELFTETAVLVVAGAAAGLVVAVGTSQAFRIFAPRLPRLEEIGIEPRMLIYTMGCAVVVALLCGLLPVIRGVRNVAATARDGSARAPRHTIQWLLVGVQVALAVTLLSGAGLLVRSLAGLSRVDPGFDASRMLTFRLSGNWDENYDDPAGLISRINTTLDELATLPNVDAVATSWTLPGAPGPYQIEFAVAGQPATRPPVIAGWRTVSPRYFDTMGIRLLEGELCRSLLAGIHRPGATLDLMVNRSFADRYFRGGSPIGSHVSWDGGSLAGTISGIVGDARELGIDHPVAPTLYSCDSAPNPFPWFILRTNVEPASLAIAVRQRLGQLEPLRSVYDMAPLEERIGDAYAQNRLRTWLLTIFAVTALGLASAGVYGTLSYAVGLRRREVALRLALGALRWSVVHQLMTTSIRIVGMASACGLILALLFAQTLSTMLYGVSPADPATLAGVLAVVLTVAFLAALIPAARATFIQPMRALRED